MTQLRVFRFLQHIFHPMSNFYQMTSLTPQKSSYVRMDDPDLDCPYPNCKGWLTMFGTNEGTNVVPKFFYCSNSNTASTQPCSLHAIFSKKASICAICTKQIEQVSIKMYY